MVWIKGPEALEAALAHTFALNINAQLDNVWTAWSAYDAINGTVPKVYPVQCYAGLQAIIPEYPAIVVTSVEGQETADGAPLFGEQTHNLEATTLCASDSLPVLDRMTKRYLVAMWEVIKLNQALDSTVSGLAGVSTMAYGRSGVYSKANDTLLYRACRWTLRVFTLESV